VVASDSEEQKIKFRKVLRCIYLDDLKSDIEHIYSGTQKRDTAIQELHSEEVKNNTERSRAEIVRRNRTKDGGVKVKG